MKSLRYFLVLSLLLITFIAQSQELDSERWKYNTIAHRIIKLEETLIDDSLIDYSEMYSLIDSLIEYSSTKIRKIKQSNLSERKKGIQIVKAIDQSLTELNFLVFIKIQLLSEGLTKRKVNRDEIRLTPRKIGGVKYYTHFGDIMNYNNYGMLFLTKKRLDHFEKNNSEYYHFVDCDLGSFLYLAIAEVNNLPMHLVEVPKHNFIRYQINDNEFFNWDINAAGIFSNEEYAKGDSPTVSTPISEQDLKDSVYLMNMSNDEILEYTYGLIGYWMSEKGSINKVENIYKSALMDLPDSPLIMNNLSWLYLTNKEFNDPKFYTKAYELSVKVDSILPNNLTYKDTYSCACAAIGDFKKALEIEKTAFNLERRIKAYGKGLNCLQIGE